MSPMLALLLLVLFLHCLIARSFNYMQSRLYSTAININTNINTNINNQLQSVINEEHLLKSLLEPRTRLNALKELSITNKEKIGNLTSGAIKIIVASCVEIGSTNLMLAIVNNLYDSNKIDCEVMYVAVRLACKKKKCKLAYALLNETARIGVKTDYDSLSCVIELLLRNNEIPEAADLILRSHKGDFGPGMQCDISIYETLMDCTSRMENKVWLIKACKLLASHQQLLGNTDDSIFLDALTVCSMDGDWISAAEIFNLYKQFHGFVQIRAYALLLNSCINSNSNFSASAADSETADTKPIGAKAIVREVLEYIVTSNIDSSLSIANLILRYYCRANDSLSAYQYFNRMKSLGHLPSTLALLSYYRLLKRSEVYTPDNSNDEFIDLVQAEQQLEAFLADNNMLSFHS